MSCWEVNVWGLSWLPCISAEAWGAWMQGLFSVLAIGAAIAIGKQSSRSALRLHFSAEYRRERKQAFALLALVNIADQLVQSAEASFLRRDLEVVFEAALPAPPEKIETYDRMTALLQAFPFVELPNEKLIDAAGDVALKFHSFVYSFRVALAGTPRGTKLQGPFTAVPFDLSVEAFQGAREMLQTLVDRLPIALDER